MRTMYIEMIIELQRQMKSVNEKIMILFDRVGKLDKPKTRVTHTTPTFVNEIVVEDKPSVEATKIMTSKPKKKKDKK